MLRPVLVAGVDGSPESLAAAEWAAREALRRELPLHLVHASNWSPSPSPSDPANVVRRHMGRGVLSKVEEHLMRRCPGARLTDELVEGPATAALLAASECAELMVLGSRGLSGFTGFLVGSVAQGVVARATRPVVLVRAGEEPEDEHRLDQDGRPSVRTAYQDVVLGLDLSDPSDEVIGFAFEAARVRGARLRVIYAWSGPSLLSLGPGEIGLESAPERAEEWRGFLEAVLQVWREKYPGVDVDETVVEDRAATHLVYASSGAGLIVVGRRIHEGRVGPHAGPVTHALVHHAHCPVAVVAHD
ncbi:nucleotide-binding universal stress UspA family protein [Streptomyces sp. B4I13]|uniref:universal stress protein n=1 Tax=Streptomyces sp. B4I13 TaxID=3042271 RepID=UPI0027853562|nr:universal stress protein [Streptomyces sp. B4I13]MDQ0958144.1 nucleotide-binding universal stress UspA family protein [Streptomyces sp. B4I13]